MSDNVKELKFDKFAEVRLRNQIRQQLLLCTLPKRMGKSKRLDGEMYVENCEHTKNVLVFGNESVLLHKNRCFHSSHFKTFENFLKNARSKPSKGIRMQSDCFCREGETRKFDSRAGGILLGYCSNVN